MHDLATLSALQKRLRNATGPSLELDNRIHAWLRGDTGFEWAGHYYNCDRGPCYGGYHEQGIAPVTASVDAALALVEKLIPDLEWFIKKDQDAPFIAGIRQHTGPLTDDIFGEGKTAPLAILSALIAALLQSTDNEPSGD